MEEIWKTIKIAPNYEVSNLGRVRNRKGLILRPSTAHGYYHVILMNNKKRICRTVHRLVAEAFIPNPNNYPCINHKDECRTNNTVDNLEWCTYEYNLNYGNRNKLASENRRFKQAKYSERNVRITLFNTKEVIEVGTISEAEYITGVTRMRIRNSLSGNRKHLKARFSSKLNQIVIFENI